MNETPALFPALQQLVEKYGVEATADALVEIVEAEMHRLQAQAEAHRRVLKEANAKLRAAGSRRGKRGGHGTT